MGQNLTPTKIMADDKSLSGQRGDCMEFGELTVIHNSTDQQVAVQDKDVGIPDVDEITPIIESHMEHDENQLTAAASNLGLMGNKNVVVDVGEAGGDDGATCDGLKNRTNDDGILQEDPMLAHLSNPLTQERVSWFDPTASLECSILERWDVSVRRTENPRTCVSADGLGGVSSKRPRGRPRKIASSLPTPLFVPSTPSSGTLEAHETWNVAKMLGVTTSDEGAVIEELRKSKRIQLLEAKNPTVG